MKKLLTLALAVGVIAAFTGCAVSTIQTQTISLNTGLLGQAGTTLIAVAGQDDDWRVTADPINTSLPRPAIVVDNTTGEIWLAPLLNSRWISAAANKYHGALPPPRTSFTYGASFNLPACFSSPKLTMQLRADDLIRRVVLNGITIFNDPDPNATASATKPGSHLGPPLSIIHSANFQPANQLDVLVEDVQQILTGLDVAGTVTYEMGSTGSAPRPPGMVAWWPLDEQTGTTVYDIAGGHNGTTIDAPGPAPIGGGGPTSVGGSYVGNSLQFGFNKWAEVPHAQDLNFGTGDFTIDAWVKYTQPPVLDGIVEKRDLTQSGYTLRIGTPFPSNQAKLQLIISNTAYQGPDITAPVGTWIFVAATRTGNTVRLYVNNTSLTVTSGATPIASSTDPLRIGYSSPSASKLAIDELEIFNRALSQQEIQSIFSAGSAGKCK